MLWCTIHTMYRLSGTYHSVLSSDKPLCRLLSSLVKPCLLLSVPNTIPMYKSWHRCIYQPSQALSIGRFLLIFPGKRIHHLMYAVHGIYYDIAWHELIYRFLLCLSKIALYQWTRPEIQPAALFQVFWRCLTQTPYKTLFKPEKVRTGCVPQPPISNRRQRSRTMSAGTRATWRLSSGCCFDGRTEKSSQYFEHGSQPQYVKRDGPKYRASNRLRTNPGRQRASPRPRASGSGRQAARLPWRGPDSSSPASIRESFSPQCSHEHGQAWWSRLSRLRGEQWGTEPGRTM